MKIRENCYMLGLGSTGGKIYKEFVQRHYKGAAANGSEQDHKALGDVPNKYILQGFDGFGGHRERAMDCLAGNEDFIKFVEGIKEDIVFILFAGGGSTGSGCAPIVAEMLLEEKDEEGNPVKTVCPVIALPASGESLAKHKNAYETVQELQEIEGLGATFFLNNDSNENYDYINKNFASMLDEFLSNESYGRQNNFDESERLEMLKDSGAMVLSVTGDLVNFFMSPEIRQFVNHYDLIFDEDMCSLSALLQWMWRSQIRNGKPIDIYIPSERMRELLNNWIQNCYVTEKAA